MPAALISSITRCSVKRVAELPGALGDDLFHQPPAGDVAGAVARLPQVEVLLEAEQRVAPHPAARRPVDVNIGGLRHRQIVGVRVQVAQPARGAGDQHDPDDLARARRVVVQAGVHHPLFHRRRHALGTAHPDVVEQRLATDRVGVRRDPDAHVVPPVIEVGPQRNRIALRGLHEEVAVRLRVRRAPCVRAARAPSTAPWSGCGCRPSISGSGESPVPASRHTPPACSRPAAAASCRLRFSSSRSEA